MCRERKHRPQQERPKPQFHGSGRREPSYTARRQPENEPVAERTHGHVWTRIWENIGARDEPYLTVSQHRLYERDGQTGVTKSLHIDDAENAVRGMRWAIDYVTGNSGRQGFDDEGYTAEDERGQSDRQRRVANVRRVKQLAQGVR